MPELPEVEAARRAVQENCCGHVIRRACVAEDGKVIEGVAPAALEEALTGRRIVAALRKGKNMWLHLDQRPWPSFQFGMSGAFHIKGVNVTKYKRSAVNEEDGWPSKFSKVFLVLDNGLEVSFTDKRRFARVRLLDDPIAVPPISELGPDAFIELPDVSDFIANLKKRRGAIKSSLLDQSFLAGIGNWVGDEVLYQAKIHPENTISNLSEGECTRLHTCIKEVINLAIEVDADSERFPKSWIFHYRWGKKVGKIDGKKIEFITVGGRTSAYVPQVQICLEFSQKPRKDGSQSAEELVSDEQVQKNKQGRKSKKPAKDKKAKPNVGRGIVDDGNSIKMKGNRRKINKGKTAGSFELTDEGAEEIIKGDIRNEGKQIGQVSYCEEADEERNKTRKSGEQKSDDLEQGGYFKAPKVRRRRSKKAKENQTQVEKEDPRQGSVSTTQDEGAFAAEDKGTGYMDEDHVKVGTISKSKSNSSGPKRDAGVIENVRENEILQSKHSDQAVENPSMPIKSWKRKRRVRA